jgi:hypothetical protein
METYSANHADVRNTAYRIEDLRALTGLAENFVQRINMTQYGGNWSFFSVSNQLLGLPRKPRPGSGLAKPEYEGVAKLTAL